MNNLGTPSSSNAFLLPQWGGIVIHTPNAEDDSNLGSQTLDAVFSAFSNQLLTLLGVPSLPEQVQRDPSSILTGWQLDALLRRRTLENAQGTQDTLRSILKLVEQIESMPVGSHVKGDIQNSLAALEKVFFLSFPLAWSEIHFSQMFSFSSKSLVRALGSSAEALTLASRAFFNPGMLALLYFPAEHKYAVYTPLFASAVIPLIAAALREVMAWKRQRREELAPGQREREHGGEGL